MNAAGAAEVVLDDIAALESRVDAEASIKRIDSALRRIAKRDRDVLRVGRLAGAREWGFGYRCRGFAAKWGSGKPRE
jgi:hypothetical protein